MVDVDHFKLVNDRYGHACGDRALRLIADTLRTNTRVFDSLARYGGEEFVVVMPGTGAVEAEAAAERLRAAVEAVQFDAADGVSVPLTVSVGVACTASATTNLKPCCRRPTRHCTMRSEMAAPRGNRADRIGCLIVSAV